MTKQEALSKVLHSGTWHILSFTQSQVASFEKQLEELGFIIVEKDKKNNE